MKSKNDNNLVGAIDQGTSSTRFIIFRANTAEVVTYHQVPYELKTPNPGWVEQDPMDILRTAVDCMQHCVQNLTYMEIDPSAVVAIGITNQRQTSILWDKNTGEPLYNAIVWLDMRTSSLVDEFVQKAPGRSIHSFQNQVGLPLSTYFSALKIKWLIDNVPEVRKAIEEDRCLFGTVDTWLLWKLTGGVHATDVTNASGTMLMNITTLTWDKEMCDFFGIPMKILPKIRSSSEIYSKVASGYPFEGVPISAILGDQQAALVGQLCFNPGEAKNTYGTGCFFLCNVGKKVLFSSAGLLTVVAYKFGNRPAVYALEGSVAIAGAAVSWLRDNLGFGTSSSEIEKLASEVKDTGDCYFVPAFSGLFAPYWRKDARGTICGLTQYTTKQHIARATLEAVAFSTKELIDAVNADAATPMKRLTVDGGMTRSDLFLQIQADLLGIPVVRSSLAEATALGVAIAAGMADGVGVWSGQSLVSAPAEKFTSRVDEDEREMRFGRWKAAVERSFGWRTSEQDKGEAPAKRSGMAVTPKSRLLTSLPGSWFFIIAFGLVAFTAAKKEQV